MNRVTLQALDNDLTASRVFAHLEGRGHLPRVVLLTWWFLRRQEVVHVLVVDLQKRQRHFQIGIGHLAEHAIQAARDESPRGVTRVMVAVAFVATASIGAGASAELAE